MDVWRHIDHYCSSYRERVLEYRSVGTNIYHITLFPFADFFILTVELGSRRLILWYYFTIRDDEIIRDQIIYSLTVKIRPDLAV